MCFDVWICELSQEIVCLSNFLNSVCVLFQFHFETVPKFYFWKWWICVCFGCGKNRVFAANPNNINKGGGGGETKKK